jgi:hypothetical protein
MVSIFNWNTNRLSSGLYNSIRIKSFISYLSSASR